MPKKETPDRLKIFNHIISKYYMGIADQMRQNIRNGSVVYPSAVGIEEKIKQALDINCSYRIYCSLEDEMIKPVMKGDSKFPFSDAVDVVFFFKYIHPAFLVPYIIYCAFAYELSMKLNARADDILSICFQIPLPIKFPNNAEYSWYLQRTYALSLNNNNQILSHINTYHFERKFIELEDHEYRFIEGSLLKNEQLHELYQQALSQKMKIYYQNEVFLKQHWDVLRSHNDKKYKANYEESTIYTYNKDIIALMKLHTGYSFGNIKSVVAYLKKINVL